MGWSVSQDFLDALGTAHEPVAFADLWFDGQLVREQLPLAGGSVAIREDSKVRRSLTLPLGLEGLTVPGMYDLLTPFGAELHVSAGITVSGGYAEVCPVGVFVLEDASQDGHYGNPLIQAGDRSVSIQSDRFLQPHNTAGERTIPQEIAALLQATIPGLEVYDLTFSKARTPTSTWDRERWDCCEALAASIGAEVFFDPEGRGIIRPVPEIDTQLVQVEDGSYVPRSFFGPTASISSWDIRGGLGGTLSDYSTGVSRDRVYNGVVVTGETQDTNVAPVTAFVYQRSGPLRWGGPFRKVARFYSSPVIRTEDAAVMAGRKVLARSVAYSRELMVDVVPNPAMDVGDQANCTLPDGTVEARIMREITLPFGTSSLSRVGTRVGTDIASTTDLGTLA